MLYREIIAVCSEIHAKHVNAMWAEHRISECQSWCYVSYVLSFKMLQPEHEEGDICGRWILKLYNTVYLI